MSIYKIYEKSPIFIQNIFCSLYGWKENKVRFSKYFHELLESFVQSDRWDGVAIYNYKKSKLIESLLVAKKSNLYLDLNTVSDDEICSKPFEILNTLAILKKDTLIARIVNQKPTIPSNDCKKVVTSGTTGRSLSLLKDKKSFSAQWAIWFRHRSRFGIKLKDLSVNITANPSVPLTQKRAPYWRFNSAQNQYLISMQHINKDTIVEIVRFLNSIRPTFYSGYPSVIAEISRLAADKGLKLSEESKPSVIFTGCEKLLSYQANSIESWLGVQVTDQYGLTEGNCNFSKCEHNNYHEDFEFCHIELADVEVMANGNRKGRLIGTAFFNMATPLLRYDTGDIAVFPPDGFKCLCGRNSQVILDVDGRVDDYILTPDNRRVMRLDYLFKETYEVIEAQVIQDVRGEVLIKATQSSLFCQESFETKVKDCFRKYISKDMTLSFQYVENIERSNTGKFKAVINRLDK